MKIDRSPVAAKRWPLIVVALLLAHVAGMATAVTVMVRRGQAAVIPDYYERAVRYDELKAARARRDAASTRPADAAPTEVAPR